MQNPTRDCEYIKWQIFGGHVTKFVCKLGLNWALFLVLWSLPLLSRSGFLRESILVFDLFRHIGAIKCTSLPPYLAKPLEDMFSFCGRLPLPVPSSRDCYDCQHIITCACDKVHKLYVVLWSLYIMACDLQSKSSWIESFVMEEEEVEVVRYLHHMVTGEEWLTSFLVYWTLLLESLT